MFKLRHFGSVAERSREEERTAVLPAFATPRCIPVARTAVLLACPCSFCLSGSRTQRRVGLCCSRALLTHGCSWCNSSSRVEKMLRPKRAWTLDPQVPVNDSTWHENDNTIECWKPWSHGKASPLAWTRKVATVPLRLCWEENWQVELRWDEPTRVQRRWEEKGEMKRELRRVKKMCTRWEVVGRVDKWFHNLRQEVRSPGKEHGSLLQLL